MSLDRPLINSVHLYHDVFFYRHDHSHRYHDSHRDRSSYHSSDYSRPHDRSSDHSRPHDQHSRSYERSSDHHSRSYEKKDRRDDHHRGSSRDYSSESRHHSHRDRNSDSASRHSNPTSSPKSGSSHEGKRYGEEKRSSETDREKRWRRVILLNFKEDFLARFLKQKLQWSLPYLFHSELSWLLFDIFNIFLGCCDGECVFFSFLVWFGFLFYYFHFSANQSFFFVTKRWSCRFEFKCAAVASG